MEIQLAPNSVDQPSLLYKLQRKIKVFNTSSSLPNRGYNLVGSASKYGIVFVGSPDGTLSVYYLKDLINNDCEPQHQMVKLLEKPTHIAVSCDQELLAVTGGQHLNVYKIINFQNQNVSPSVSIKYDVNPTTFVSALQWNPCIPDTIAVAFFDGTLLVCQVTTMQVKKVQSKARCLCWSPKGKQIVTGNSDGSLCQYKPDLSPMKAVPPPNLFEGAPVEALAVYWISTYQFAVVYKNATDNTRPAVTIINTPKAGQPSCLNYEDICYSMGSNRPWYYYLQGLAQWNMILSSSSNSMEIATLGSEDGVNWLQWCQADDARPELPLTDKKQENYPIGLCIDNCAIHQLPWGENETLPYMPLLHVVSQTGILSIFNVINLNKNAIQICMPAQQLTLPAMISAIPDDVATQPPITSITTATPALAAQPKPQSTVQFQSVPQSVQMSAPISSQFGSLPANTTAKPFSFQQPQQQSFTPASTPQVIEQKQQLEAKPAALSQPQTPPVQIKPVSTQAPKPQPSVQTPVVNAALKAEQEKINKMKANQELKSMLIREVNEFQMELYNFIVKTREVQAQIQSDLNCIDSNINLQSLDTELLKKDCSLEELRGAVVQLKLELVRTCAAVAEARTYSDTKDLQEWTQADPLTSKRVASVKKLAYYVQTQLEQAYKALDYKWNEMDSKDPLFNKPGQRMIRPILDDVYQPLVKQQEILSRQQAVLKTLKKTFNECDAAPVFKSTSLLRSTPFRNKDPLSKLTKNILNMSLETQNKTKDQLLTPQKVDALRDMLSNHKTVKIKPVNIELRHHLASMRLNYEKSVKEKLAYQSTNIEPKLQPAIQSPAQPIASIQPAVQLPAQPTPPISIVKIDSKPEVKQQSITVSSFTPVNNVKSNIPGLANVARTLFTDESKIDPVKLPQVSQQQPPQIQQQPQTQQQAQIQQQAQMNNAMKQTFGFAPPTSVSASVSTRSMLKDLLQSKSQAAADTKNNANTFMGQKICTPTAFSATTTTATPVPSVAFTSKPISDINNMFSKFQTQAFVPTSIKPKSDETGEPETAAQLNKSFESKTKDEKPLTNLFGMRTSTPLSTNNQNVSDVLKSNTQAFSFSKMNNNNVAKPLEKMVEKSFSLEKQNENIPQISKQNENISQVPKQNENTPQVLKQNENIPQVPKQNENIPQLQKQNENIPQVSKQNENIPQLQKQNENIPQLQKQNGSVPQMSNITNDEKKENVTKPLSIQDINKAPAVTSAPQGVTNTTPPITSDSAQKPAEPSTEFKTETPKTTEKHESTSTTTASSIFAAANAAVLKPQSIFGATTTPSQTTSIFGVPASITTATTAVIALTTAPPVATTQQSVFATSTATTTTVSTASSIFGSAVASQSSIFGQPTTQSGCIFGTSTAPTASSLFGSASTQASPIFETAATTTPSVASSVFGTSTTQSVFSGTPSAKSSVFSSSTPVTTSQSVFGSTTSVFATTTTTQSSVFGSPTSTSIFGVPACTQASVFGSTAATTVQSVFGAAAATSQSSIFGGTMTTTQSVFGTNTTTTQASVFGTAAPTQASVFGSPTPATQASIFGATSPQASVFGTSQPATQASVFGTPTQTNQTSVFGSSAQTTQASVFGAPVATTAQSGSLFGGAESNLFAAASISTTSAPSQTSGGNIFGGSSSGSVFGSSNTNVFGGKATFGQPNPTAAAIFGGATSYTQKPATNFWSGGNTSVGSGFGSSGFGQQATTQTSSIFGGSTGGSFSSPTPAGQTFGSPPTAAFGSSDAKPSVFGSPQQQGAGTFGGSPVFGSKPVFGQSASFASPTGGGFGSFGGFNKSSSGGFGAPAAFGGSAAFGAPAFGNTSPTKVFGGASPGFGTSAQSNTTFENLATQDTLTFGNLAQQSGQPPQQQPSFNTSPSFTGWRG